jgi:hypothetical protein
MDDEKKKMEYGYIDPDGSGRVIWLDRRQWLGFYPAYSREVKPAKPASQEQGK